VLVRTDLSPAQIAVQAVHAAIEASRQFLTPNCEHPHIVLCGIASEQRLLAAADRLFRRGIRLSLFREPDRGNEATALATEPLSGDPRRELDRFQCLRADDFRPVPVLLQERGSCRDRP
jgi:hypothetical protein